MYTYRTRGVCSQAIEIELSDDAERIEGVRFYGGCNGNLNAISKLVKGQAVDDVVDLLAGNTCGFKPTSCADQLTIGLREAQAAVREG